MIRLPELRRSAPSAVTDHEAETLMQLAQSKRVLELGAHYGFSTVVLSKTAQQVISVDWHRGDDMAGRSDSLGTFIANNRGYDCRNVIPIIGQFQDVLPLLREEVFDGIFLDGLHTAEAVARDTTMAWPLLRHGGWFAWHDFNRFEVKEGIEQAGIADSLRLVDWLAWRQK